MARLQGSFVWYELVTDDLDAAAGFYGTVVGWTSEPYGGSPAAGGYRLFKDAAGNAAGLMVRPDQMKEAGGPPQWLGYVGTDDVDATAAAIEEAGGSIWMAARDFEGIGRIALVADRGAAPIYLMKPATTEGDGKVFDPQAVGRCAWNELTTDDQAGAFDLYGRLFGWRKDGAMAMGEMGDYSFLSDGDRQIGAVMGPIPGQRARWRYYFRVADIDRAAGQVTAGGDTIAHGPAPVPTGDHILIGADPQGAEFALVGKAAAA